MKRYALIGAIALTTIPSLSVARDALFGDAVYSPAYSEKISALIDGQPDWVTTLVTRGGVSMPGRQIIINDQIYGVLDTCRPSMCNDYALKLIVKDGSEAYIKVYGKSVEGGPYVLGEPDEDLEAAILNL